MGGCGSKEDVENNRSAPKTKKKKENWEIQCVRHDLSDEPPEEMTSAYNKKSVNCMAINEDQSMLASGSDDGKVRVWSTKTERMECLASLEGHNDYINAVLFEGFFVVSASADKTIRKWDISNGECVLFYEGHTSIINRLICTGDMLFSSSYDKTARAWDFDTGAMVKCFTGHKRGVYPLIFIPDFTPALEDEDEAASNRNFPPPDGNRDLLITGSADMSARAWSFENGRSVNVFAGHRGAVTCMTVDNTAKVLFTGSTDYTIRSWNIIKGTELKLFEGHQGSVTSLTFKNKTIYSASADHTGRAWVSEFAECTRTYKEHKHCVTTLKVVNGLVYTASGDGIARIFDAKSGALKRSIEGHARSINCLQVVKCEIEEPDDELEDPVPNCIDDKGNARIIYVKLFTGSYDGTVRVWDAGGIIDETDVLGAEEAEKKRKEREKAKKKKQKEQEKTEKKAKKTQNGNAHHDTMQSYED